MALITALAGFMAVSALAQDAPQDPVPPKGLGPRKDGQAVAPAGGAAPAGPKVNNVATYGQWQVQCSEAIPANGAQPAIPKSCGMVLGVANEKNQNIGMQLIINRVKQGGKYQTMMRALVPIGVYLPTGIAMEIDGNALEGRMSFTRCNPRACEGFGEASDATMKKFMKGQAATFYVYDRPGNGYPLKFKLEGFAKGIADLDKM
ncbi:MAG: invasion associated locus B family protein [Alphaproteobacteria bacterium]|nr:invasion associated locus B family protein [Alphaproteobacteria bacterium]